MQALAPLTQRYGKEIRGVIECFDRVVLFGTYKAIGWPGAMEQHLWGQQIKLLDYTKSYANTLRLRVAGHVREEARRMGVSIHQVNHSQRKEALVEDILQKRGRHEGVVCVLGAMERCRTYKVGKDPKSNHLALQWSPGKCQHYYIYLIERELGLSYLRIPTWAPFRLQFYCNGHHWLERRMRKAGNCLTRIKHSLGATSLKMYDKAGTVLRIECTTSDVKSFTHYRKVEPRRSPRPSASKRGTKAGSVVKGPAAQAASQHAPMRKTLYSLPALSEAMSAVNQRYLAHISQWPDRTRERHDLRAITASVRDKRDRSHRGLNFFRQEDVVFMQALQRGEHQIRGLRNRSLQQHLPGWSPAKIGRALRRCHAHGLLKKVAGTHKYYLTKTGSSSLVAAQQLVERLVLPALAA